MLGNLKTRTAMNAKISVLFVLKWSYICYYIIYMIVPLSKIGRYGLLLYWPIHFKMFIFYTIQMQLVGSAWEQLYLY